MKKPVLVLSKTFEVWSPDDIEAGEADESGFSFEKEEYDLHEAVRLIKQGGFIHPSESHGTPRWLSTEGETHFRTGEETVYSLHPAEDRMTQRLWAIAVKAALKR